MGLHSVGTYVKHTCNLLIGVLPADEYYNVPLSLCKQRFIGLMVVMLAIFFSGHKDVDCI